VSVFSESHFEQVAPPYRAQLWPSLHAHTAKCPSCRLSEMTGYARNRRFRYAPYIALFNDMGPGEDAPQGGT
jgi:hypothetical protein